MNRVFYSPQKAESVVDKQNVIQFASNYYLGLADNEHVISCAIDAIKKYGTCSGGSRWISGTTDLILELENRISNYVGAEDSIVFSSGYMTNIGAISSLCCREDFIFSDELNHASIIDGIKLSRANVVIYRHNDIDDLRQKILELSPIQGMIVTDSVFSMDGDVANIPQLIALAKENGLKLMVDEAHSLGVLGRISLEYFNIPVSDVDVIMGTFSKTLCSEGGFICGKKKLVEYIRHKARSYIFSAAPEPAAIGAVLGALDIIETSSAATKKLQENISYFSQLLVQKGIYCRNKLSAIFPIRIGDLEKLNLLEKLLYNNKIFVPTVKFPAVKVGNERLRFSLMATHTFEQFDFTVQKLSDGMKDLGLL